MPPGRATRIISSIPRAVSLTLRSPNATVTTPNVSPGNGSRCVSASISVTRSHAAALRTLLLPKRSISWQKSEPMTGERPRPARW